MSWHGSGEIPFERLAAFIRQMTHDIRNGLNAVDLQSAYLAELVTDPEVAKEVSSLRRMSTNVTKQLQTLSKTFQEPKAHFVDCPANMLLERIRDRHEKVFSEQAARIEWKGDPGETEVQVDLEGFIEAVNEIFRNAFQFGSPATPITALGEIRGKTFVLEIREKKDEPPVPPATWGKDILASTRRGGYGLGLFRAQTLLSAQGADLDQTYDRATGELVSRITVPLSTDGTR